MNRRAWSRQAKDPGTSHACCNADLQLGDEVPSLCPVGTQHLLQLLMHAHQLRFLGLCECGPCLQQGTM